MMFVACCQRKITHTVAIYKFCIL